MKVALLYWRFYDIEAGGRAIGGVETYLPNLAEVCRDLGWTPLLFQNAPRPFKQDVLGTEVNGIPLLHLRGHRRKAALHDAAVRTLDLQKDIVIFGSDIVSIPTTSPRAISIQHGIDWDLPVRYMTDNAPRHTGWRAMQYKRRRCNRGVESFENCRNIVCVDYNFLNYYRAVRSETTNRNIWVIPNFTRIADPSAVECRNREQHPLRILFARRFTPIRGAHLMAEAADTLARRYPHVTFTFAGDGPEEEWLRRRLHHTPRVRFTRYLPEQTQDIHLQHHIAVVPSLACEGTSLSVAEAMGAGCAVVSTPAGGITNMILSGYNGLLAMPTVESLTAALERMIQNEDERVRMGLRARESAAGAFSHALWKERWTDVLRTVAES